MFRSLSTGLGTLVTEAPDVIEVGRGKLWNNLNIKLNVERNLSRDSGCYNFNAKGNLIGWLVKRPPFNRN